MEKILNQLIQLQELYFALDENRVTNQKKQLKQLEQAIKSLLAKLPSDTADFFQNLQRCEPPAMAPVADQTCCGCGIELPTSLNAEIMRMDNIYQCPNCARFLYPYQGPPLKPRDNSLRFSLPRLGIERFSSEKLMLVNIEAKDKENAIAELVHLLASQLYTNDPKMIIDQALRREAITSTALDNSLAFPHIREADAGGLTFTLGLNKKGIKFGAPKNRLTRIIFFIVIPFSTSTFYLRLLAGLIESLQSVEARKKLLNCSTPAQLWKTLKQLTGKHIP